MMSKFKFTWYIISSGRTGYLLKWSFILTEYVNNKIFRYVTSDRQEREEYGTFDEKDGSILEVEGYFSYLLNGKHVNKYYKAGRDGSQFKKKPTHFAIISETDQKVGSPPKSEEVFIPTGIGSGAIATLTGGGLG